MRLDFLLFGGSGLGVVALSHEPIREMAIGNKDGGWSVGRERKDVSVSRISCFVLVHSNRSKLPPCPTNQTDSVFEPPGCGLVFLPS